jgi:exonuclease SbcC
MHISKVELENIKSHIDSKFEFSRGTTAITGRNGAGKTTIIEAIAWTLFDVLDYKKEDFVRRGEKRGSATVTFESGLDEREYIVYRDTMTAYYVFDPQLGMRVADKREEVTRFLWQHLGLEPGTDLRALFREAVGVPQGTLTAIFHGTPLERKSTFDRLLKVEEYRQAAEKLRETSRFVEGRIGEINVRIARAEGELARFDVVEQELKSTAMQADVLSATAARLSSEVEAKEGLVSRLGEQERKASELGSAAQRARTELERAQLICRQSESEFRQAFEAAERVAEVREKAERHTELVGRLKELEYERQERDRLREELNKIETALITVQSEHLRITETLENALRAHAEIEPLKAKVGEQERLEKSADELKAKIAASRAVENQIKSLDDRLTRLRESYRNNQSKIREAELSVDEAAKLAALEQRDSELVHHIAELRASLERDEKFQSEIQNGLCPILSEKCLNLEEGRTLDSFIKDQFTELKAKITALEVEKTSVSGGVMQAKAAQERAATLETLLAFQTELTGEGKYLSDERLELEKQLIDVGALEDELKIVEKELAILDNPKARIKLLQETAAHESDLRQQLSKIESNIERLESDRRIITMRLESYKDIDTLIAESSTERDDTAEAHRIFLANEALAVTAAEKEKLFETARMSAADLSGAAEAAEREADEAGHLYDREFHTKESLALRELERKLSETSATLDAIEKRREQLGAELEKLTRLRDSLKNEFSEKERLSKVVSTTKFIRDTLREAAPRVARNYVHHVSVEACQMFREICGHAEQTLCWSEDYGISLEEEGYERPFGNLSGGEQMVAALSVRLAILKQLSDIRIAFFDEPTTNMDAERRENLAQQISQIKNFDQLFVISHDDTFEGYVDNTVRIGY